MYEFAIPDEPQPIILDENYVAPINTISGVDFNNLIDTCFRVAHYFSLSAATWTISTNNHLKKILEPYLIKIIRPQNWFCYYYPDGYNSPLIVNIYKATPESKKVLLKCIYDIFLHDIVDGKFVTGTQTLENLCIFTSKSLILGTVTHENICHIYPPTETIKEALLATGEWIYEDNVASEQININNYLKVIMS